jgi:hypothetical protein
VNTNKKEEQAKLLKKIEVEEELRRVERTCVEYSAIGSKVTTPFIIIFGMRRKESV